ncbi:CBS domain-containing protein CBSX1, chloroplastic-like [Amaranthus tricolor]|uniref:CBS domain-containing protein CBSX1, chloroplastic-like n=1 Tax=Amaranthus tricolor TaxID=29722 RepID=UPI0025858123|nr:CBS domain-containing protein CBSX1, chloroplastic-like [Amaranthus tricolor]
MDSKLLIVAELPNFLSPNRQIPSLQLCRRIPSSSRTFQHSNNGDRSLCLRHCFSAAAFNNNTTVMSTSNPSRNGVYTVGDFMTKKEDLVVVKPSTTVDEALETLVEYRITGFPVINDDWELVGVVSDYDLLALDSISGSGLADNSMFPEVDSTWKVFNEIQRLLGKTNGKLVSDVMTQVPVVVRETTNLEDAARLLLETRYRRLPVLNADGKLVGIITRGNVIRAALQIKRQNEK